MGTKIPVILLLCLCCSLLSTHVVPRASSLSFNLSFSDPASACGMQINCNKSYINSEGMLELTENNISRGTIDSIGRATYAKPVPLWRHAAGGADAGGGGGNGSKLLLASFTTSFTFRITPDPRQNNTGDGMAFFLTPYPSATEIPPRSGGGGLGLLAAGNSAGDSRFVFVAVEFDTWDNGPPNDINGNHMGIDNTSIVSISSTSTISPTGNLTSDIDMTATISYHNVSKQLTADLLINGSSYHVNATIDLSYFPEDVAVGFSAATGLSAELHRVLNWSFSSTLESETTSTTTTTTTTTTQVVGNKLSKKLRLVLSLSVPILSLLLCFAGTYLFVMRRRRRRQRRRSARRQASGSSSDSEEQFDRVELERGVAAGGPKRYTYSELANTTNNFADEKKLGRGGFGSVYLGQLAVGGGEDDRRAVAIKMLSSESSAQGRKEFEAEVRIISRLKHRNLVQLLGWCDSRNGLMLVYELVAKGSLDRHLYSRDSFLTWPQRYKIILGLGSALRYLHKEWEQCIVHGDIKPSNIMLDESHGAKLGDFGLARLVDHGAGWQTTKAVLGTAGYIDPEFVNTRRPSTYSDVYSFGIVLLEIVCNRPPVVMHQQDHHQQEKEEGEEEEAAAAGRQQRRRPPFVLLKWVWSLYGKNATLDAADERLRGDDELHELSMEIVLVVGLWCAHPDPSERPSIEQAMHVLQSQDRRLLPALPPQMYKTVLDVPTPAPACGALSIDVADSGTYSSATTSNTNPSDSSSSALLRNSYGLP